MLSSLLYIQHLTTRLFASLTFESVDEILSCYHSNETSSAVHSHGTIILFSTLFSLLSLWMKSYGVNVKMKPFWQNICTILSISLDARQEI